MLLEREDLAVTAHRRGTPGFRRITLALFAAGLATFTTLYGVQSLLPALTGEFEISPATASLAVSLGTAGLAVGIIPLTALSAVWGRTRMMTASLFAAAVLCLAQAFSPSFTALLVLRGAQGLVLAGLTATAMSYLAEEIDRGSLGFAIGLYVAGNSIGGMAGRLIASLVLDVSNWRWALGVVGVLALGCAVLYRALILPSAYFRPAPARLREMAGTVGRSVTDPGLLRLFGCGLLLMGCFVTVYNYLSFRLLAAPFRLSHVIVGLISVVYLAGAVSSALAGRMADAFGRPRMLWASALVTLAGVLLMAASNLAAIVAGLVVTTVGFFAAHSTASSWVGARAATLGVQGPAIYLCCYYVGSSLGGWLGGFAYGGAGWGGVTGYIGALVVGVLLLALGLRSVAPATPRIPRA
ncbi:MFS transporter [Micromonospora sp. NPDC049679]|uniref:MFS transporter n=1 Tax=Micromonospora sp. NPDC049679 TaxID=3155920 RepID=UPI003411D816